MKKLEKIGKDGVEKVVWSERGYKRLAPINLEGVEKGDF